MRYRTLLERTVDEWENGHSVVQIVSPEESDENELRFCYYKDGEFVNRPLTVAPSEDAAEAIADTASTMVNLARRFSAPKRSNEDPYDTTTLIPKRHFTIQNRSIQ